MAWQHDTMMTPPIEGLLDRAGSKFTLDTLGAKRARQINSYFGQLGEGLGTIIPPQVNSVARKPLSIALEEIAADKIVAVDAPEEPDEEVDGAGGELGDGPAVELAAVADEAVSDDTAAAGIGDVGARWEPEAES